MKTWEIIKQYMHDRVVPRLQILSHKIKARLRKPLLDDYSPILIISDLGDSIFALSLKANVRPIAQQHQDSAMALHKLSAI